MTFHIGQKVVCVGGESGMIAGAYTNKAWPSAVHKGGIYVIRDLIHSTVATHGVLGLLFQEYHHPLLKLADGRMWEIGFPASYFRPVVERETDISIFTRLLTPTKERVE